MEGGRVKPADGLTRLLGQASLFTLTPNAPPAPVRRHPTLPNPPSAFRGAAVRGRVDPVAAGPVFSSSVLGRVLRRDDCGRSVEAELAALAASGATTLVDLNESRELLEA